MCSEPIILQKNPMNFSAIYSEIGANQDNIQNKQPEAWSTKMSQWRSMVKGSDVIK